MPAHFYIDCTKLPFTEAPAAGSEFDLFNVDPALARHIATVLRYKAGQHLTCFDGAGLRFTIELLAVRKREIHVRVDGVSQRDTPPTNLTHLVLSLLKGQAMDRAVQLAAEMGATRITLLRAARSNVNLESQRLAKKIDHWQRIVVGACEQSGRSFLPSLHYIEDLADLEGDILGGQDGNRQTKTSSTAWFLLEQSGRSPTKEDFAAHAGLLVGPEGGWQDDELTWFDQQGVERLSLGSTILRAETVPAAALTLANYLRG